MNKTIILDTNVYGELLVEKKSEELIEKINQDKSICIYGIDIIEKELKDTPEEIKYQNKILKDAVLSIYKTLVNKELRLFPVAQYLATEYYKRFDELRNSSRYSKTIAPKIKKYKEEDLKVDFQIIAVASIKNIDIVVSTDKRTILSEIAEDTYKKVNNENNLRTPILVKYSDFRKRYSK